MEIFTSHNSFYSYRFNRNKENSSPTLLSCQELSVFELRFVFKTSYTNLNSSYGNLQPWRFIVVRDRARRRELARVAYGQSFLAQAPVVITVCAVPQGKCADLRQPRAGVLLSPGQCGGGREPPSRSRLQRPWRVLDEAGVAGVLWLVGGWRPVALLTIGHPAEPEPAHARRPLDEVVLWLE